jgi:TonB family protein
MSAAVAYRSFVLPWSVIPEDELRYNRIKRGTLIALLVLSLLLPFMPVPDIEHEIAPEVPQRYAKFILEKRKPPPPPPKPEPVVEEVAPEPVPVEPQKVVQEAPQPTPEPKPESKARERAAKAGVMAFADALADLRQHDAVAAVSNNEGLTAGAGETQHNQRALITSRSGKSSGGINTAGLSRNTGGSGLAGRATTQVASTIAPGGTGGGDADRDAGAGRMAARSREEIEMVFDQNKGAIYALYSRALRKNPALRGKLVLKLTIAPSGQVTDCLVVSSELGEASFEKRLIARVKMFRFEAKDVATVTTTKPIDFFPA